MQGKKLRVSVMLSFLVLLFIGIGTTVFATNLDNDVNEENNDRFSKGSPWMEGADNSIYSNSIDSQEEEQKIEPEEPGTVEKYFAELLRNTASSLISLLEDNLGAGIDRIIFGRVGSGQPNRVNVFGFELRSGNPYGVTAAVCYSVVRSMVYIFIGILFVFLLAKSAWGGQTGQSREAIKSNLFESAVKFTALALMPYLFDVAIYIRDVALYGIKEITGLMITDGATLSLSNAFLINAERTGRFIDALMYLGTVVLTLFFAVMYIAMAIDLLICFISFPILCAMSTKKRDLIGAWKMSVLSDLLTPIIDAILLLIPLLTSLMLSDVIEGISIIQLIMCMLILPSRQKIKALLGVQSNAQGGLFSAMGLMALGRMIAGKAKGAIGKLGDIRSDFQKSGMHKKLAEADEEEQEFLLGGFSGGNSNGEGRDLMDGIGGDGKDAAGQAGYEAIPLDEQHPDYEGVGQPDGDLPMEASDFEDMEDVGPTADISAMQDADSAMDSDSGMDAASDYRQGGAAQDEQEMDALSGNQGIGAAKTGLEGESKDGVGAESAEPLTRNQALRNLDQAMEKKQDAIEHLRMRKAGLQNKEKEIARQMLDYETGSDEYKDLEKKRADTSLQAAETEQKIAEQMKNMNTLRNQAKTIRGNAIKGTPTKFDEARARILCKRANISNFEQPDMRNALSNTQMKKLYRQRAIANIAKGTAGVAGSAAGGALLGGASVFLPPAQVAMSTAAGMVGGSALASGTAGLGIAAVSGVRRTVNIGRDSAKRHRDYVIAEAVSSVNAEDIFGQAPDMPPNVPLQPTYPQRSGVGMEAVTGSPQTLPVETEVDTVVIHTEERIKQVRAEIEHHSAEAMKKVISDSGGWKTSAALKALERANIDTEKYLAAVRETKGEALTPQMETEKRIEIQTERLTEEVMRKLTVRPDYGKGTEKYLAASHMVREKVRKIVEKKNKDHF